WIFSGAIEEIRGDTRESGQLADVFDFDGNWIARAYYNSKSQITCRVLTWEQNESIDENFWRTKLEKSLSRRNALNLEPSTSAYRLVNAESDGLPGLVVDKYGDYIVIQAQTAGIDRLKEQLVRLLIELLHPVGVIERSDMAARKKEGLRKVVGVLAGTSPPEKLIVQENDYRFVVDLYRGHKTGLYLDQRENRLEICKKHIVHEQSILNVFAYTGGFAVYAAANRAATITNVDSSEFVLEYAKENVLLVDPTRTSDSYITGDAFKILRQLREEGKQYDMIVIDPPKFAHNKKDVPSACRGYKDLNLLAMQLIRPNGILATFSCSGLVSEDLFQKVLFGASIDAKRDVQILKRLGQSADHPILLTFPESSYLKGFLCRVF
ncbi:MAG: class I SAM-dependent rRNA methyltransferase, partial [Deltaproteobacteria bacterium]|nr:class I SAM-dependent rRNA methyltransferase [Deltaproteobacteria bacterium]